MTIFPNIAIIITEEVEGKEHVTIIFHPLSFEIDTLSVFV